MSSDTQFTAHGPTGYGFLTNGSRIAVGVGASGFDVGVVGSGGNGDGVVGISGASSKSGVVGINNQVTDQAFGVLGICNSPNATALGGSSTAGVGMGSHSNQNDGAVGVSDAINRSGVFGFNSSERGPSFGVSGIVQSPDGVGVLGSTRTGTGVAGVTSANGHAGVLGRYAGEGREAAPFGSAGVLGDGGSGDGLVGLATRQGKSGVFGNNVAGYGVLGKSGTGIGVGGASDKGVGITGASNADNGVVGITGAAGRSGVLGESPLGIGVAGLGAYGGEFAGSLAPLRLIPATSPGPPAGGTHGPGEFYVDSQGTLFFCTASPGTWKKVQLT